MSADPRRRLLLGSLVALGSATLFGTLGPISRFAYEAGLTPLAFTTWRALVGGLVLGLIVAWRAGHGSAFVDLRRIPRREQLALATAAGASMVLNLAIFTAFDRISVALALLGFYTYPAFVALATTVLQGEPLGRGKVVALGLASSGMALVLLGQLDLSTGGIHFDTFGFALALLAAGAQVVNVLVSRRGFRSVPTDEATTVVLLSGGLSYLLIALLVGQPEAAAGPLAVPAALPLVLTAGILGAAVPSLGFLTSIRWIGGVRTGILMLFEPVGGRGPGRAPARRRPATHPGRRWRSGDRGRGPAAAGARTDGRARGACPRARAGASGPSRGPVRPREPRGRAAILTRARRRPRRPPTPGHRPLPAAIEVRLRVRKAVFPAAGWGTRFLPATKAQPKEMLPLVDKPVIQYAVEEAVAAGIEQVIIVTSSQKRAIEDHFDSSLRAGAPARGARRHRDAAPRAPHQRPGPDQLRAPEGAARVGPRGAHGPRAGGPRAVRGDPLR